MADKTHTLCIAHQAVLALASGGLGTKAEAKAREILATKDRISHSGRGSGAPQVFKPVVATSGKLGRLELGAMCGTTIGLTHKPSTSIAWLCSGPAGGREATPPAAAPSALDGIVKQLGNLIGVLQWGCIVVTLLRQAVLRDVL